ncbi:T6SS effector BTH_I2691 family protein [Pseudomonas fontis]|uniref:Toxin VasX N-terminal region domain-containing protein n=1 Tax=Pseudomonas fontis TaxID=2942633 RepID=A0ABT5NN50_9PSED|nr:T6SS effector BTH_I2691 family protein [Pseudomonas fontis]MDD0973272.1 hypothetical protein [Pseudomonas fontis]MDD0989596.1 hypothetical protein [Pseudomonas fontis]
MEPERLREILEQCKQACEALSGPLFHSPTVNCTRAFSIFPMRYGVVGGPSTLRDYLLPQLPAHLRRPHKVGRLAQASYAIRPLREGFLYVLERRTSVGSYAWHSQFRVSEIGSLQYMEQDKPWAPPPMGGGIGNIAWMFTMQDIDDIEDVRLLYSPAPLTQEVLRNYRVRAALRDTLASIDLARLTHERPPVMDNVLPYDQLKRVADFAAADNPQLRALLASQAFSVVVPPEQALYLEMMPGKEHPKYRGVGIVVDDALGIAQELNAWRNASAETLEAFMGRVDGEGLSNQRKFTIAMAIDNIRLTLADEAEVRMREHFKTLGVTYTSPPHSHSTLHVPQAALGYTVSYRDPAHQQQAEQERIEKVRSTSWEKYAGYVDEPRRERFLDTYRHAVNFADSNKEARAGDHLLWLKSAALLEALDRFDRNDQEQALLFEDQMAKVLVGMNATAAGEALLSQWREAGIARDNLFWRALAQNQDAAADELANLLGHKDQLAQLDDDQLRGHFKKLTDLFDKSHALADELANSTEGPPTARLMGGALLVNALGNTLFQSKLSAIADKPVNWLLAQTLKARLGRFAEHFSLESRGGMPLSRGAQRRIERATQGSFSEVLQAGAKGPMAEVRIGSVLVLLEVWNLTHRLNAADKQSKEYVEIAAALLGLTAAGLELGAVAVGFAEKSGSAVVREGTAVFKGGLRLGAGILAGGVAGVGVWYDIQDMLLAYSVRKHSFSGFYAVRAIVQAGAAGLSIAIGLAVAGPFLNYLVKRHGTQSFFGQSLLRAAQTSSTLVLRMTWMLRGFYGINIVLLILTVVDIVFMPDALQRYLDHSSFRKDRSNGIAETEEQELKIMVNAIKGTL